MGFFDKFFKGKKIIEETVEKAIESDEKIESEEPIKDMQAESEDKFSLLASKSDLWQDSICRVT